MDSDQNSGKEKLGDADRGLTAEIAAPYNAQQSLKSSSDLFSFSTDGQNITANLFGMPMSFARMKKGQSKFSVGQQDGSGMKPPVQTAVESLWNMIAQLVGISLAPTDLQVSSS